MKHLGTLAIAGLLAATAHAQYTAPARGDATTNNIYTPGHNQWEIDGGLGFLAGTNLDGVDDGFALHVGGYYLDPINSTRETTLKYGVEYFYGNADGNAGELSTHFFSANIGGTYRFAQRFEAGLVGGVGFGVLDFDPNGPGSGDSSGAFGYQLRPEITGWITDRIGVSLSYRFLHTVALDDNWGRNPIQHAIEFSVKARF